MSRRIWVRGLSVLSAGVAAAAVAWRTARDLQEGGEEDNTPSGPAVSHCQSQSPPLHSQAHGECEKPVASPLAPPDLTLQCCRRQQGLEEAVSRCRGLVRRVMVEQGVPGALVAVSRDGEVVWSEGLGWADVENDTPCTPASVMRIASISKPLTAVGLLQLYQQHKVDLDVPVQTYLPDFPRKRYQGEEVHVTVRQLLSHLAGIRHYTKQGETKKEDSEQGEFYISTHYSSLKDSIKLFADDDLLCKPGSEFHYTTHGWTLLSAVIESVSGQTFLKYMRRNVFGPLGMDKTLPELHGKIIDGRSRHYVRKNGTLRNTPYVDLSYKWAGGGFLSNAEDLVKFGNAVLASWQLGQSSESNHCRERCLLAPPTTALMLTPAINVTRTTGAKTGPTPLTGYGMGWFVRQRQEGVVSGRPYPFVFLHSGGAVGASSILAVLPKDEGSSPAGGEPPVLGRGCPGCGGQTHSQGVVVAVIFNLQKVKGVLQLGIRIAEEFSNL